MQERSKLGLILLAVALGLGVLGDTLLHAAHLRLGLNLFLWIGAIAASFVVLQRVGTIPATGQGRWLLLPAALLAAGFLWRASGVVQALDLLGLAGTLALTAAYARGGELRLASITDYVLGLLLAGAQTAFGPLQLVGLDIEWKGLATDTRRGRTLAVLRGLLLTVPLILLFGSLFVGADAVFARLVRQTFDFELGNSAEHIALTLFCTWLVAGWLRTSIWGRRPDDMKTSLVPSFQLGPIETSLILGSLNLLFLAFVAVQFRYFFGGAATVLTTDGLTYAEYARRGFFELVKVSVLVLPLLLLGDWLQPQDRPAQRRVFRWLAATLVGLLYVIMVSALQRMRLYQQEFGLTELRLYTTVFMGWLGFLFLWFLVTILRDRRNRFAFGALVSGLAVIFLLNAANPNALIVRTNAGRISDAATFDSGYAMSLGADAVPDLVKALPSLPQPHRGHVAAWLLSWSRPGDGDWRSWNWGRRQARATVKANLGYIQAAAQDVRTSPPGQ
ncbi:MAG: DUF4153 domain-containing protein [Symbiobacteriia bacterium]